MDNEKNQQIQTEINKLKVETYDLLAQLQAYQQASQQLDKQVLERNQKIGELYKQLQDGSEPVVASAQKESN